MSTDDVAGQRKGSGNNKAADGPECAAEAENGSRKRPEIEVREMEVDDIAAVFHRG